MILINTQRTVACISIILQSVNVRCNALQSVIGVFLHTANAPETIIKVLSRLGMSISKSAIYQAVSHLEREAMRRAFEIGRTLLGSLAYDNFNLRLHPSVPTLEGPQQTMLNLTSATYIPLYHGVNESDLLFANELWEKSYLRIQLPGGPPPISLEGIRNLYPDKLDANGLGRRDRANAFFFLRDLVENGPEYFKQFRPHLDKCLPDKVKQIELRPNEEFAQVPLRAADADQSKVQGNIDALINFLNQGGIGDTQSKAPFGMHKVIDPGNQVILVHGDLSTGEKVESIQRSRSAERTPFRRFQHLIFVPGLFHLKMACADAIWRIFIKGVPARASEKDANCLPRYIEQIRPKHVGYQGGDTLGGILTICVQDAPRR
jgi:hypothetical protein